MRELVVDNFAGGGGASEGIEQAIGRAVDIAINHDEKAIEMHKVNHPNTKHYIEDVWKVDPLEATQGQPVGLAWFSPDCKHFSKAKGGKPVDKNIRGLAWVAVKWAKLVHPRIIILENVEEFRTWGPLVKDEQGNLYPDPTKKGQTFDLFIKALERQGYKVEFRELRACDYGAPTTRKRFFMIARCDGKPIIWPEPTHADPEQIEVKCGLLNPWRTAAECIDWSIPITSIFDRKKPLAENTLRRIAIGIDKFIINNPEPYILNNAASFLIQYHTETSKNEARGQGLNKPLNTIDTNPRYALVSAFITKFYKTCIGQSLIEPLHTITTSPGHFGLVQAFLISYYGNKEDIGQSLREPLRTITTKDRFSLVTIMGKKYQIADIGMRMLQPHESCKAQGFPDNYIIDRDSKGKRYPLSEQTAKIGNSVCPPLAKALVSANYQEITYENVAG
jgi:DNA (cytosine-5)-methyltransferase 1